MDFFFSLPSGPDGLWGPPGLFSKLVPRDLFTELKRPGREADYLPPSSAEVKNAWS
jgi:hypothetical protein